jgi:serine/threonine kinase 32
VNAVVRRDPVTGESNPSELLALKRQEKARIIKKPAYLDAVWAERNIMAKVKSPFLTNLLHAFQSPVELFLVMPFMQGGDLRFQMNALKKPMPEDMARFYAAEIALGLEELHSLHIVYRDLKPDNVLLDSDGHIRISDFGVSDILDEKRDYRTSGRAGTFGYMSPEMLQGFEYGTEVDVWSFGIVVYELLHHCMPWTTVAGLQSTGATNAENNKVKVTAADVAAFQQFKVSRNLSQEARDFLSQIFAANVKDRLGCTKGWEEIKAHAWFKDLDWNVVMQRKLKPPIQPDPNRANCTATADLQDQLMDFKPESIPESEQKHFKNFEFNNVIPRDLKLTVTNADSKIEAKDASRA